MDFAVEHIFTEMALILGISAVIGFLATRLKQPLIVAFIAVGILVGPSGLDLVESHQQMHLLAEMGIAILLFVVGLKLDLHLIRTMGPVALATGLGQVLFTSVFGFLIALALGMSPIGALYVAVALTFSSTIIIVKLLSDKREIDSLHGRIAIGFLIVQDIAVVLAMILLTALGAGGESGSLMLASLGVVIKGIFLLATIGLLMRYVLPRLMDQVARSQELLLLFSIAWAVMLASGGELLGFSKEVGAFLAGISLATTPYREAISSRLVSLRDFLLLFFFINLGSQLDLSVLGAQIGAALIFSAFVLIGNPIIVMVIMGIMGYRKRTGFLAGLTVAQISEFSLILAALGLTLGHIDQDTMGLITLVGLITIGTSTYMILYSHQLYEKISPLLSIFERRIPHRERDEDSSDHAEEADVILFGLGRYGRNIATNLLARHKRVLGVDFDPQIVAECRLQGLPVRYGDAEDPEILEHLPLHSTQWVVNATPGYEANLTLLKALQSHGFGGKVVLTAHNQSEAQRYREAGADKVLWPYVDAAEQAVDYLTTSTDTISAGIPWPVTLGEVRLRPGSQAVGKHIRDLDLRARTGVSIIAVDRAGQSYFDPGSDFLLMAADRLVLLGSHESLDKAARILEESKAQDSKRSGSTFRIEEVPLIPDSPWEGRSLAELDLRGRCGITVIGIRRGDEKITSPSPNETLRTGDILVVVGSLEAIGNACRQQP
ncbi:transporter, CPA2 family [Geoalkalibacter ferrihydriticus]|uniref:Transporter, CPA2 family n=1 Tax=Geoalkalibacter ferrihydriticus TaxID=392333 RepID=A0A1G9JYR3_9BACT|nr:cation:proton antiporter [Geoalkalibacter ferrihydriticus]SDL42023.1 transporter, CPA2 family [Geoalkalibacter ferrihydriticus]